MNNANDLFNILVPVILVTTLAISVVITPFVMATVQKFKELPFITEGWQIWILNLLCSALVGFIMSYVFWDVSVMIGAFIGFFVFLGAPALYEGLKAYTPTSLKDTAMLKNKIKIDLTKDVK